MTLVSQTLIHVPVSQIQFCVLNHWKWSKWNIKVISIDFETKLYDFIFYLHCVHRGKSFEMSMINLWAEGLLTQHLSSMPSGDFVISTGQTLEKIRTDWFVIQFNLEEICKYIVHLRNEFIIFLLIYVSKEKFNRKFHQCADYLNDPMIYIPVSKN